MVTVQRSILFSLVDLSNADIAALRSFVSTAAVVGDDNQGLSLALGLARSLLDNPPPPVHDNGYIAMVFSSRGIFCLATKLFA